MRGSDWCAIRGAESVVLSGRCVLGVKPTRARSGTAIRPRMFTVPWPGAGTAHSPEAPPSFPQFSCPVRFLNPSVELADLLGQIFRLLLQLRGIKLRHPLDLAEPVPIG